MIGLPMIDLTVTMRRFAKKTEKKTVRREGMSWNGLRTSLMSVDSKIFSITARDISVTRSKAITDLLFTAGF